eukprot:symbB.v1.2.020220.t1/scaffold1651.1/size107612/5
MLCTELTRNVHRQFYRVHGGFSPNCAISFWCFGLSSIDASWLPLQLTSDICRVLSHEIRKPQDSQDALRNPSSRLVAPFTDKHDCSSMNEVCTKP